MNDRKSRHACRQFRRAGWHTRETERTLSRCNRLQSDIGSFDAECEFRAGNDSQRFIENGSLHYGLGKGTD